MRLQKIHAPNYNQTGTNRADIRIAPYSTRTSIRQVVPKWVPKGSDYPTIETSRRLPELSITIKTSSNVIGTYIFWQCLTIPKKTKLNLTTRQYFFLSLENRNEIKPRHNKYFFSTTIASTSVNIDQNNSAYRHERYMFIFINIAIKTNFFFKLS